MAARKPQAKPKPKPKNKKAAMPMPMSSDKQWQTENDARTLKQAMEVQADPKRMKAAQEYCTKEMEALKQVSKLS